MIGSNVSAALFVHHTISFPVTHVPNDDVPDICVILNIFSAVLPILSLSHLNVVTHAACVVGTFSNISLISYGALSKNIFPWSSHFVTRFCR